MTLLLALSLSAIDPAAHAGALLGQLPPPPPPPPPAMAAPSPAAEREVTIRALREELEDLQEKKSSIGYVFPALCIAAGVGLAVLGTSLNPEVGWPRPALMIGGAGIAALSSLWLIVRIVRTISLSGQISDKEDQLRILEAQRVQVSVVPLPGGGAFAGLRFSL